LTSNGLFQNMEASLVVDFRMNDEQGLLDQIEKYYRLLLDKTSPNVQELTQKLIKQLFDAELILKEKERRKTSETSSKSPRNQALLSKIKDLFPPVKIQKNTPKSPKRKIPKSIKTTASPKGKMTLIWEKENLTKTDAQQVSGRTKPKGVLHLRQGQSEIKNMSIQSKTHFRSKVFGHLNWTQKTRNNKIPLEETKADFYIEINGVPQDDTFPLKISHSSERSGCTRLHWGNAIPIITKQNITGKTLSLFQIENEADLFLIKIE